MRPARLRQAIAMPIGFGRAPLHVTDEFHSARLTLDGRSLADRELRTALDSDRNRPIMPRAKASKTRVACDVPNSRSPSSTVSTRPMTAMLPKSPKSRLTTYRTNTSRPPMRSRRCSMPLSPVSARRIEAGTTIAVWPNSGSNGIVEKLWSQIALEDWVRALGRRQSTCSVWCRTRGRLRGIRRGAAPARGDNDENTRT
jgi:hypothetical protein